MENYSMWIELIVAICGALTVCVPLVIKLASTITAFVKEKNWNKIIETTMGYMTVAETMFETGAEKKEWVMQMIQESAKVSNFDLTEESLAKISELIDQICKTSKHINTGSKEKS